MLPEVLEVIRDPPCEPAENMRRDLDLLMSLEEGRGSPSIRTYRWKRLCLSAGYSQKVSVKSGLDVVRRPTGGGILIHGWDLSFSITGRRDLWGRGVKEVYTRVSHSVAGALRELGLAVKSSDYSGAYGDRGLCWWHPTFGELTSGGRKVVSMAMRTLRRAFLIQGTVYDFIDYPLASRILGVDEEELRRRVISLGELGLSAGDFEEALIQVFRGREGERLSLQG